jgi:hypothetical protein
MARVQHVRCDATFARTDVDAVVEILVLTGNVPSYLINTAGRMPCWLVLEKFCQPLLCNLLLFFGCVEELYVNLVFVSARNNDSIACG